MADFGSPIAQDVNVSPQQNIQTLSGLLNLKRQQVGLEQQQQELQTQTAQAYQATQSASERQALAKINWKQFFDNGDIEGAQKTAMAVAPTTGAEFSSRLGDAMQAGLTVKSSAAKLNQQYLEPFRNAMSLWAADPNANIVDLANQVDAIKRGVPKGQQGAVNDLASATLSSLSGPNLMTGAPKTLQEQKAAALAFGRLNLSGGEVAGTGGLATPITGTAVGKSNALVGTAQSRTTGAITQAPGQVGLGLTPTQTPNYLQAAAGATAAGGGVGNVDVQRFAGVTNAAATAQTGVALADQVAALADQVRTGELSKEWADKLTVLKQTDPTITARQMLAKYAAQLKTTATQGAATDSERAQIDAGMPSPESMNPAAVRDAAQYLHGYFRMNQARGMNALQHAAGQHAAGNAAAAGLSQADTSFMQKQDPFVYAFRDMNPAQQRQFLINRYGPGGQKDPAGFADFEKRVKGTQ